MQKNLNGEITVSFPSSNGDGKWCEIKIEDKESGQNVTIIKLSPEQFFDVMSNRACVDCQFEVYDNFEKLGKVRENKTVTLLDARLKEYSLDKIREVINENGHLEVDGWKFRGLPSEISSLTQGQHNMSKGTFEARMVRYVDSTKDGK